MCCGYHDVVKQAAVEVGGSTGGTTCEATHGSSSRLQLRLCYKDKGSFVCAPQILEEWLGVHLAS